MGNSQSKMTVPEARRLIFKRVCQEFRRNGEDHRVSWRELPVELKIPADVFEEAMAYYVPEEGGLILQRHGPDHIRLGPAGIWNCRQSIGI